MYMEQKMDRPKIDNPGTLAVKETIKKTLLAKLVVAFEDDTRLATQELEKERINAIEAIVEEQRGTIRRAVEEGKKSIWAITLATIQSEDYKEVTLKEILQQSFMAEEPQHNGHNPDKPDDNNHKDVLHEIQVEVEILPPRDQNEIAIVNTYLINMPEIKKVELINMVDKSLFKIVQKDPVNLVERLNSLPQVLNAQEVVENNQKKITITLTAKSKLDRNNNMMNEKVNEIFSKRKR